MPSILISPVSHTLRIYKLKVCCKMYHDQSINCIKVYYGRAQARGVLNFLVKVFFMKSLLKLHVITYIHFFLVVNLMGNLSTQCANTN